MTYTDEIAIKINAVAEDPAYAGAADDQTIKEYEKFLGVKFPSSYILFLKKYGTLSFAGEMYYGITKGGVNVAAIPNVAFATKRARADGDADEKMVIIKASGYGPIFSIDASIVGKRGEAVIVETKLSFKRDGEKKIAFQSFEDFFISTIMEAIEDI